MKKLVVLGCVLLMVTGCHRTSMGNDTDTSSDQKFEGVSSDEPDCGSVEAQKLVTDVAKENSALLSFIAMNGDGPARAAAQANPQADATVAQIAELEAKIIATKQQCAELAAAGNENIDQNCAVQFGTNDSAALGLRAEIDGAIKQVDQLKKQQSDQKYGKLNSAFSQAAKNVRYGITAMIMTDKNEQTGMVQCKASLHGEVPDWGAADLDITYQIEKTTDGQLLATLYGLQ